MKDRGGETVKGTSWISSNSERKERVGGERHGAKDRSRDDGEIGLLADNIAV